MFWSGLSWPTGCVPHPRRVSGDIRGCCLGGHLLAIFGSFSCLAAIAAVVDTDPLMQWLVGRRAGIIDNGAEAARLYHAQRCSCMARQSSLSLHITSVILLII